jgi:hypothetical protein
LTIILMLHISSLYFFIIYAWYFVSFHLLDLTHVIFLPQPIPALITTALFISVCFSHTQVYIPYKSEIMQYFTFCVWFILLSIMYSRLEWKILK